MFHMIENVAQKGGIRIRPLGTKETSGGREKKIRKKSKANLRVFRGSFR